MNDNPFLVELRKAQTRQELILCWKVFSGVKKHFEGFAWDAVVMAFRKRCEELGIEWRQ